MSTNDFLETIKNDNENYRGKMKSITFVVKRGNKEKKIFKWLFEPGDVNFYITFPYFESKAYYCGTVEIPEIPIKSESFNAVKNGKVSAKPVKFSYHKDGNVHFKQSNFEEGAANKWEKLAKLKASPITELDGEHLFTIRFEGLDKFKDLKKHKSANGEQETLLKVPEDIINFEIRAYAGSTQKSLEGQVKKGAVPWFEVQGQSKEGIPVFVGVYAILSRKSHIIDDNKNGLTVLVGFDRSRLKETGRIKSLYLFAR